MFEAVALAHFPKITYARFKKVWEYFSNFSELWQAEIPELVMAGWEEHIAIDFVKWRETASLSRLFERLKEEHITTPVLGDPSYPPLLAEIADPPFVLFIRGTLPPPEQTAIAIVGTRRSSIYGKQVTEQITRELAEQRITIVSGLALGIDGFAHTITLDAQGTTIAVLGSGVDTKSIYPVAHQKLAERIIQQGGAVISEYPPGFEPTQYSFPARNRIIAGLSAGTVVMEAPLESGALITARAALDYNREVFAIPHPITSVNGAGCNKLLKLGAKLVTETKDIIEELQIQNIAEIVSNNKILPANEAEAELIPLLSKEPVHIDTLIRGSNLDSSTVNATLLMMEMKGKIKNLGGMMYVLRT